MTVPTAHILALAAILFSIGLVGFFLRKNVITVLLCIELMLNAANLTFLAASRMHSLGTPGGRFDLQGPIFAIFVIVIAAVEAAVGLALVIALYRLKETVALEGVSQLKG